MFDNTSFSINFKSGKTKEYKSFFWFERAAILLSKSEILYLGWSDSINACGYSTNEWKTIHHGVIMCKDFASNFKNGRYVYHNK